MTCGKYVDWENIQISAFGFCYRVEILVPVGYDPVISRVTLNECICTGSTTIY
jgi:hypothetical protein